MVLPDLPENRVQRINANAALSALQLFRQLDHRDGRVVARAQKERDRITFDTGGRCYHVMHVGPHEPVRGQFEKLARVDDEGARNQRSFDPHTVFGAHSQTRHGVLQQDGDEAAILVSADTLVGFGDVAARITDDLQQLRRLRLVDIGEDIFRLTKGLGDCFQHIDTDTGDLRLIGEH